MENYHFEIISHMVNRGFFIKKRKKLYCLACPKFISPAPTIFEQRNDAQWAVRLIMYFHNKKN